MSSKQLLFNRPIPQGWQMLTVDEIKANEPRSCVAGPFGSSISSKYFVPEGVPVIRGNNLTDNLTPFVPHGFAFVSEEKAESFKAQQVKGGDLVFTCWGTLGQVGLIPYDGSYPTYIISNKQLKLRPNLEICDPRFLYYYFASPQMVQHIRSVAIGAAVPGINLGILKSLQVVLPPLPIERKIVGVLSAYDDLIENNTRRIEILEEMARSLYREWFVNFRFPGHEQVKMVDSDLGLIPEGWEVGRLDDALFLQRGFDITKKQFKPGLYDVISSSGFTGTHNECKVKAPGVVIGRKGTLNSVFFAHKDFWPTDTTLWVKEFRRATPLYAFYLLSDLKLEKYDCGAACPTLNRNDIHGLPVILPPQKALEQFNHFVEPLLVLKNNLLKRNDNLRQARDLLLPKLISGEIDVENLDINTREIAA